MKASTKRNVSIQLLVFVGLFSIAEIILRLFGMKAGVLIEDFIVEDHPVYEARFQCDSLGMNTLISDAPNLIRGTYINRQGFRSSFDFTPATVDSLRSRAHKKVLMMIGDSYTEGCCPDSLTHSFPDMLNRDKRYAVLNFGVAGTDLLQYALVAEKYAAALKPDLAVIIVYLGNDMPYNPRKVSPGVPICFPFRHNKWINYIAPDHLAGQMDSVLPTPEAAYTFFLDHYTLKGNNRNWFEKSISHSVILSKLYLFTEHFIAQYKWNHSVHGPMYEPVKNTRNILKRIENACTAAGVPCLFACIPAPVESDEGEGLKKKYGEMLQGVNWLMPYHFTLKDYDGRESFNHFTTEGHAKYADFLKKALDEHYGEPKASN